MASFVQDGLFLIPLSGFGTGMGNQVGFSGPSGVTAVLVAFHQIIQNQISPTPSTSICPTKDYVVRVNVPNNSNINLLAPNVPSNNTSTTTGGAVSDTLFSLTNQPNFNITNRNNVVIFQPLLQSTPIMSNQNFSGRLIINGQTFSGQYRIVPQSNFAAIGYTEELPTLLSNCADCGCQSGYQCFSTGLCQAEPDVCDANSVCGQNNGACPGECFANNGYASTCQFVSGGYQCVLNQSRSVWDYAIAIIIGLILIIVVFYLIGMIFYRSSKPLIQEYPYQTVGDPVFEPNPCQPNGGTWYQMVQPVIEPVTVNTFSVQPVTTVVTDNSGRSQVLNTGNVYHAQAVI